MPVANIIPKGKQKTNENSQFLMTNVQGFSTLLMNMVDYSLGSPDYETKAAVKAQNWRSKQGRKRRVQTTLRGEKILESMYELSMPEGYARSDEIVAATQGECSRQVFIFDPCDDAFDQIQNAVFDEVRRRNTPIQSAREDGEPLNFFSKINGFERSYRKLSFYKHQDVANALYAVDFKFAQCQDCSSLTHQKGSYGGGGQLLAETTDQFATGVAVSSAVPASQIVTDIYQDGDVIYATYAGNVDPATATTGGIVRIVGGVSTTVLSLAAGMYGITFAEKKFVAVGATGRLYESSDGITWTLVANTVLASTHFKRVVFEPKTGKCYIAGHGAADGAAATWDGNIIVDITSQVGTLTGKKLQAVKVLSSDDADYAHVAFGGDSGFYSENGDLENNATWTVVPLPTITDTVSAIEGDSWRTYVGAGTKIHQRSIFTKMDFATLVSSGITGNITDGATGITDDGVNYVVFVTNVSGTSGKIYMLRPAVSDL